MNVLSVSVWQYVCACVYVCVFVRVHEKEREKPADRSVQHDKIMHSNALFSYPTLISAQNTSSHNLLLLSLNKTFNTVCINAGLCVIIF